MVRFFTKRRRFKTAVTELVWETFWSGREVTLSWTPAPCREAGVFPISSDRCNSGVNDGGGGLKRGQMMREGFEFPRWLLHSLVGTGQRI